MNLAGKVVVASALACLLVGCATIQIGEPRVLTGLITDESGKPVGNTPVLIVGRSLAYSAGKLEYDEHGRQKIRAVTNAQGQYRIEFVPANFGNNFYLFFYDETGFDRVKYRRPESLDITPLLARDTTVTVNQVLRFQPSWAEVERQIALYGPDSDRGKILQRSGLPEKRETIRIDGEALDVWWYYTDGLSYFFAGDTLRRTHAFPSIREAVPER
jgi:hypothetical protein